MRSYKELIESGPTETEIRSYLVEGEQVSVRCASPIRCARRPSRRGCCADLVKGIARPRLLL